jgi:hypothetical protein
MTGVITTILMTFIYLVTSSLHRTMLEENELHILNQNNPNSMMMNMNIRRYRNNHQPSFSSASSSSNLFITIVLPSVVNPNGRTKRLNSITNTWGPDANAIYVIHDPKEYIVSSATTTTTSSISSTSSELDEEFQSFTTHNTFPQTLYVPPAIATVDQGVPRLQYVMEQIYTKYNPDYVFFVNDHTFVIPQHICTFLYKLKQHKQKDNDNNYIYAGHALKPKGTNYAFNSGAAGYFLSRSTIQSILSKQQENDPNCSNKNDIRSWLQGNPGLVTANCLKESMNVDPIDTRDELGRHIFHAYGIVRTTKGDFDSWYVNKHPTLNEIWGDDKKSLEYEVKKGKECCSPNTISFHYVEYAETLALHATFQHIRELGGSSNISDGELQKFLLLHWPTSKKDIGGYSHNLPPLSKKDIWDDLLFVIKNIAPRNSFDGCLNVEN